MTRPVKLRGKKDPYITMPEMCDMLNAASGGKSAWTTWQVRRQLRRANAVTTIPEDISANLASHERRISSRRHYFTTLALLRDKLPAIYERLIESAADEDVSAALDM